MTYFFSQRTQKNRKHRVHRRSWPLPLPHLAPPPSPSAKGGAWSPRYPYREDIGCMLPLIGIYDSSNALWPLYAEGVLWTRNVRKKPPWTQCALWEKKLPAWEKGFSSVWGQNTVLWWANLFVMIWVILNLHEEYLQRVTSYPFIYDRYIDKMENYNVHDFK